MNQNMTPQESEDIVLYLSKKKTTFGLILCTIAAIAVMYMKEKLESGDCVGIAVLWFAVIIFALLLAFPDLACIRLSICQMEVRYLLVRYFFTWDKISHFQVGRLQTGRLIRKKVVVFHFAPGCRRYLIARLSSRVMANADFFIQPDYGLSVEAMTELLNQWRNTAISRKTV
jgi:hypothetical protein